MARQRLKPIKLSSGKVVQCWSNGDIEMVVGPHGDPIRLEEHFTASEKRELYQEAVKAREEFEADAAARTIQHDPRVDDVREEIIAAHADNPEALRLIDTDPQAFNAAYREAREYTGISEAEIDAQVAAEERADALRGKLTRAAEGPHGKGQNLDDLAELIDLTNFEPPKE